MSGNRTFVPQRLTAIDDRPAAPGMFYANNHCLSWHWRDAGRFVLRFLMRRRRTAPHRKEDAAPIRVANATLWYKPDERSRVLVKRYVCLINMNSDAARREHRRGGEEKRVGAKELGGKVSSHRRAALYSRRRFGEAPIHANFAKL